MPRRYTSAIATASKSFDAGDATKVIEPFNIVPGQLVAVVARVSHLTQRSHLADQTTNLRGAVENRDGIVIEPTFEFLARSFNDDGPCDFRLYDYWPSALAKVARTCRRVGAVMLVESTSRYVRNGMCSLLWRKGLTARSRRLLLNTQPTDADFADLRSWTEGVRLMTLLPPTATPADERRFQRERGQAASSKKGGRPKKNPPGYKKLRREEMLPEALRLHEQGESLREIARRIGMPHRTICDWIGKYL